MATRLGLDLGTNSVGWALFELSEKNEPVEPVSIVKSGARIFPSGRNPKSNNSLNEDRRGARSARRLRDRYLQRREHLMLAMIKHGLMPEDEAERKALQKLNPYQLRALAVEKGIPPHHVGRALFHINQRRGFKSNRKKKDKDSKIVGESIKQFKKKLEEKGRKTLGAFLYDLNKEGKPVRVRREGTTQKDLYDLYPSREMLEDEFECIWNKQSEVQASIFTDNAKVEIKGILFKQRPLKRPLVGKCTLIPEEDRAPVASPLFQAFRIWQDLNNLKIRVGDKELRFIELEEPLRKSILEKLFSQETTTFKHLRDMLEKAGHEGDIRFNNLETDTHKKLNRDEVSATLQKKELCGAQWLEWDLDKQTKFVHCLLDHESEDDVLVERLVEKFGLAKSNATRCIEVSLPDGYGKFSEKAILEILPAMKEGKTLFEAAKSAGRSIHHSDHRGTHDRLPSYPDVISHYAEARKQAAKEEDQDYRITNPTVHIALNQLRKVVNDIIRIYGKPQEIHLELVRQLKLSNKKKKEQEEIIKKNQETNARICEFLEEHGVEKNRKNIERVRLWEELSKDPHHRCCVYTGKPIGIEILFSDKVEVEHILPFTCTLDDSRANKILSFRQANRDKGKKTPDEAFNNKQARPNYCWEEIRRRADDLPSNKGKRFCPDAVESFLKGRDFLAHQLTDTSYIGKAAREYLTTICLQKSIVVIPGRLTAQLRKVWGLNEVLGKKGKKNREDHRHHAVDAAVVGVTSQSMLQRISNAVARDEADGDLGDWLTSDYVKTPWKNFRRDVEETVQKIIVSHKPSRKRSGQLHNDTAYGITGEFNAEGQNEVTHHIPLTELEKYSDLEKIKNSALRKQLEDLLPDGGKGKFDKESKDKISRFGKDQNIRRVCIKENLTVVPIYKDKNGKPYKFFKPDSNWACEIFSSGGKWRGEIIPTFYANQPKFRPRWRHDNPSASLIMRVHIDDMLKLNIDGQEKIVRVQRISQGGITLAEHHEANVDQRGRDSENSFKFISKVPSALQKSNARKIHISPSGLIYDPGHHQ